MVSLSKYRPNTKNVGASLVVSVIVGLSWCILFGAIIKVSDLAPSLKRNPKNLMDRDEVLLFAVKTSQFE